MCGILGVVSKKSISVNYKIDYALDTLGYRGPDDRGIKSLECGLSRVLFGHTRLSIIDLSASGHQPMSSLDEIQSIVFNGEIYNYIELRNELIEIGYKFHSDSDTEVLLAAWREWGKECLIKLVGMFAFAILDCSKNKITCVRDAFGIKPFFYTWENENFLFASELGAIKALKFESVELDWQIAYDYLVHGSYDTGSRTFLNDVFNLSPGHLLEIDLLKNIKSEPIRWWKPSVEERTDINFNQATELVRDQFLNNVRLHMRSDVPLGAALSGGIDSSSVVCAMRKVEPELPINTFSFIAQGSSVSEEAWVDLVNVHVNAIPHKIILDPRELASDIDEMIKVQGEPFGSTSIYAQYRVFKLARDHGVTVTLDGQGADEMLAGYSGFPGQRIRSLLEKGKFSEAIHFLNEWSKWPGRNRLMGIKQTIAQISQGCLYDTFMLINNKKKTPTWVNTEILEQRGIIRRLPRHSFSKNNIGRRVNAELALCLTQRGLPALLRHGDRNSMRFSVESRVPFLTLDLVNLLLSLPESYLISKDGETKSIFRAAMRGIVPDQILDRRDKIGFETPEREWMIFMAATARNWLSEDLELPFLNQSKILKEFDLIISGKINFSWQVWRWINFSRWYLSFFR